MYPSINNLPRKQIVCSIYLLYYTERMEIVFVSVSRAMSYK